MTVQRHRLQPVKGVARSVPACSLSWSIRPLLRITIRTVVLTLALLALALALAPLPALADLSGHWSLDDGSGHRLGAILFEQPDPDFPPGLRLRLNAQSPGLTLDHHRPVVLGDGQGQQWQLANRSEELVPIGTTSLPAGSAQFDLASLRAFPGVALSLRLSVPTSAGDLSYGLGPAQLAELDALRATASAN